MYVQSTECVRARAKTENAAVHERAKVQNAHMHVRAMKQNAAMIKDIPI